MVESEDPNSAALSAGSDAEYSAQADHVAGVTAAAEARAVQIMDALRVAFASAIRVVEAEYIDFDSMEATTLGASLHDHPVILKPLIAACNVAARALERDLDIKGINTYLPRLSRDQAMAIAGYIAPFLPSMLAVETLAYVDRIEFIDKEIRARKGQWEKQVTQALSRYSGISFKKARFHLGSQEFEIDSAHQEDGKVIFGIDVKRIEARRDIHKRADEIVNKAAKLKAAHTGAKFGVVLYFPFPLDHSNVRDRLSSPNIDSIVFAGAGQLSVDTAVRLLLAKFGVVIQKEQA